MSKEEAISMYGTVIQAMPNAMFKIQLDSGHEIVGYTSGKIRKNKITITEGDSVTVEMSPYDLSKGRITFRN
jgi:translation initiation factor IF-1